MSDIGDLLNTAIADAGGYREGPAAVPFSEIPAIGPEDLWPGVIPLRQVTMIAAPGKTGKGLVIAAIAGLVSSGRPWPGETASRDPGSVIIVAPEDDPNEDLAWRLRAAGANLELVRDLTITPNGLPFMLPDSVPLLRQAIREISDTGPPVRLIALDPLLAMSSGTLSTARGARAVTTPLQDIARESGAAVLLSNHTVKDDQTIAGSKSLTDACRVVWILERLPDAARDNPRRILRLWASNRDMREMVPVLIEGAGTDAHVIFAHRESRIPGSRAAKLRLVPEQQEAPEQPEPQREPSAPPGKAPARLQSNKPGPPVGGSESPLAVWRRRQEGR